MEANDIEPVDLDVAVLEEFLEHRRTSGWTQVRTTRSMASLLDHLRERDVVAQERPAPGDPLLAGYRGWMIDDRGLAPLTVLRYENLAVRLLDRVGDRQVRSLTGRDASTFLLEETARVSVGAGKGRVVDAVTAPVPVLDGTDRTCPGRVGSSGRGLARHGRAPGREGPGRGPPPGGLRPSDADGSRDLAMLTMVARLGLGSVEVARLELDDIDWRVGEFMVRARHDTSFGSRW
jgi:hypothetical protein